jgi:hypothetical protein
VSKFLERQTFIGSLYVNDFSNQNLYKLRVDAHKSIIGEKGKGGRRNETGECPAVTTAVVLASHKPSMEGTVTATCIVSQYSWEEVRWKIPAFLACRKHNVCAEVNYICIGTFSPTSHPPSLL